VLVPLLAGRCPPGYGNDDVSQIKSALWPMASWVWLIILLLLLDLHNNGGRRRRNDAGLTGHRVTLSYKAGTCMNLSSAKACICFHLPTGLPVQFTSTGYLTANSTQSDLQLRISIVIAAAAPVTSLPLLIIHKATKASNHECIQTSFSQTLLRIQPILDGAMSLDVF
jgi:hypothetical protein